jgi:hypothetical protein
LSIEAPSITRKAAGAMVGFPYDRDSMDRQTGAPPGAAPDVMRKQCTRFVLRSQYVLQFLLGTGLFRPAVADFEKRRWPRLIWLNVVPPTLMFVLIWRTRRQSTCLGWTKISVWSLSLTPSC